MTEASDPPQDYAVAIKRLQELAKATGYSQGFDAGWAAHAEAEPMKDPDRDRAVASEAVREAARSLRRAYDRRPVPSSDLTTAVVELTAKALDGYADLIERGEVALTTPPPRG